MVVVSMSEDIITEMKEKMSKNPSLQKEMEKLMEDGLSQDEALDIMISAWLYQVGGD